MRLQSATPHATCSALRVHEQQDQAGQPMLVSLDAAQGLQDATAHELRLQVPRGRRATTAEVCPAQYLSRV